MSTQPPPRPLGEPYPTSQNNRDNLGDWNAWIYLFELSSIVGLIIWPWIFYAVAAATPGGLAMNTHTYNSGPEYAHDNVTAPSKCLRDITGTVTYDIIGWHMTWHNPLFLIPMTIVNLTSLAMLIAAAFYVGEKRKLPRFDPSNPISVLIAASRGKIDIGPPRPEDPEDVWVSGIPIQYFEENGVSTLRMRGGMVPGVVGQPGALDTIPLREL
ncbi:hypothetical protein JAAARDRAFT_39409 [Jaapia argillacea MUCL 33604]|uniref:Uncharacterized protein n=1 Tax=Jaapia argillacea MUCL 33604 TaxID=933084 RepID=A0A067PEY1_9AGAM|nr:hypothetical protein JAAARDRAFT_39409 [Jaapia argillacea MUCL 33604]